VELYRTSPICVHGLDTENCSCYLCLLHFQPYYWGWTLKVKSLFSPYKSKRYFTHGTAAHSGPGFPHYQGFTITLRHTTLGRTPLDKWSARRLLPDNAQHSQKRDINARDGIRTRNPSKRAAADPCLRQRCHWDRLKQGTGDQNNGFSLNIALDVQFPIPARLLSSYITHRCFYNAASIPNSLVCLSKA
jgi:hypothetical protein